MSGTSTSTKSDLDVTTYQVVDEINTASGKASYVIASRTADGETPQQQCVIESNDGESVGETTLGPATAVQVDLDILGGDITLSISGVG